MDGASSGLAAISKANPINAFAQAGIQETLFWAVGMDHHASDVPPLLIEVVNHLSR
jgi:hypothetical protein